MLYKCWLLSSVHMFIHIMVPKFLCSLFIFKKTGFYWYTFIFDSNTPGLSLYYSRINFACTSTSTSTSKSSSTTFTFTTTSSLLPLPHLLLSTSSPLHLLSTPPPLLFTFSPSGQLYFMVIWYFYSLFLFYFYLITIDKGKHNNNNKMNNRLNFLRWMLS